MKNNQPKKVKSLLLTTFRVLCPPKKISIAYFYFEGKTIFLISRNVMLRF